VGFWPAKRASAFCEQVLGGPIPISVFFSALADGSGLRIATPLASGSFDSGVRLSQQWFLEALYRLGEDESREYAGKQPFTIGEITGRGRQFAASGVIDNLERLYETVEFFPRPTVWCGEANWNFSPGCLQRLMSPIPELWAGYFVPMNSDTPQLHLCLEGAIDALTHLADWHNAAFLELEPAPDGRPVWKLLIGASVGIRSRLAASGELQLCWPENLTPLFAGIDRGEPDAIAAWKTLLEEAAGAAPKKSWWSSWFKK